MTEPTQKSLEEARALYGPIFLVSEYRAAVERIALALDAARQDGIEHAIKVIRGAGSSWPSALGNPSATDQHKREFIRRIRETPPSRPQP